MATSRKVNNGVVLPKGYDDYVKRSFETLNKLFPTIDEEKAFFDSVVDAINSHSDEDIQLIDTINDTMGGNNQELVKTAVSNFKNVIALFDALFTGFKDTVYEKSQFYRSLDTLIKDNRYTFPISKFIRNRSSYEETIKYIQDFKTKILLPLNTSQITSYIGGKRRPRRNSSSSTRRLRRGKSTSTKNYRRRRPHRRTSRK